MSVISYSSVFLPLFLTMLTVSMAGNILLVPLFGEGSHYIAMNSIATEMVNRGHNITMLVSSQYKENLSSLHGQDRYHFEVFKPSVFQESLHELWKNGTSAALGGKYTEWIMTNVIGSDFENKLMLECRNMLGDKGLMSRLRNSNFDLAVEDMNHRCPIVQYLRKNIGLPYVALALLLPPSSTNLANRWPFNPSYMPEMFSTFDHVMSFQERLINTGWTLFFIGLVSMFSNPYEELRHDFDITDTTIFYDDAELFLINSHFSLDFPRPTLPNTVMVGGLTSGPGQINAVSNLNDFVLL